VLSVGACWSPEAATPHLHLDKQPFPLTRRSTSLQVKQLTDEDALADIVRRNKELEWLLEETLRRNDGELASL